MSKVIAINAGSSSLKWQLFEMPDEKTLAKGMVDRVGLPDSIFTAEYGDGQKKEEILDVKDHDQAVAMLFHELINLNIIKDYNEIVGVGHRIVAGGEYFKDSVLINDDVLRKIDDLAEYAPLHNPAEASGIRAFRKVLPDIPSVAVFDTSFHTTMPAENYLYSIPMEYYEKFGARKYGAHGTSHRYVSERAAVVLGKPISELKLITLHMGNGVSITAVDGGKSIDTSMGFTPLAGVTMGTRSGDIDASLVGFLMQKLNLTDPAEIVNILNKKSGLLGLTGLSSDMRDLENTQDERPSSKLAIEIFVNRILKYIGSYVAIMNGVDGIVFTAGIGENDIKMRRRIGNRLGWLETEIDDELNDIRGVERVISKPGSKTKLLLIPTNEELMIARDIMRLS